MHVYSKTSAPYIPTIKFNLQFLSDYLQSYSTTHAELSDEHWTLLFNEVVQRWVNSLIKMCDYHAKYNYENNLYFVATVISN